MHRQGLVSRVALPRPRRLTALALALLVLPISAVCAADTDPGDAARLEAARRDSAVPPEGPAPPGPEPPDPPPPEPPPTDSTSNLAIAVTSPSGTVEGGSTTYLVEVRNLGPDDQAGIEVVGYPPSGVVRFQGRCRSRILGGEWRWTIGTLEEGDVVLCRVEAALPPGCPPAVFSVLVSSPGTDPEPSNNGAAVSNGGNQVIADGSFESGTPNPFWAEASDAFGTPICDAARCGVGTGSGPRNGARWAWFGGVTGPDEASLEQQITIPTGSAELELWLEVNTCQSTTSFLELAVDDQVVWAVDGTSELCGAIGYSRQTIDVGAFADGGSHRLTLRGVSTGGGHTNFFVDDLLLVGSVQCTEAIAGALDVPAASHLGLIAMSLLIAAFAVRRSRHSRRPQASA